MSAPRVTLSYQLAPSVAFAVRRAELGWIIVVNPGLVRADRVYAEALANNMIDSFEGGWDYQPPAAGADVLIGTQLAAVSRVVESFGGGSNAAVTFSRMAAAFVLPLTACAWMVSHFASVLASTPGIGA